MKQDGLKKVIKAFRLVFLRPVSGSGESSVFGITGVDEYYWSRFRSATYVS